MHRVNSWKLLYSAKLGVATPNFPSTYLSQNSNQLLILEPEDWHLIENCSKDLILLVLASHEYDVNDYIDEVPEWLNMKIYKKLIEFF